MACYPTITEGSFEDTRWILQSWRTRAHLFGMPKDAELEVFRTLFDPIWRRTRTALVKAEGKLHFLVAIRRGRQSAVSGYSYQLFTIEETRSLSEALDKLKRDEWWRVTSCFSPIKQLHFCPYHTFVSARDAQQLEHSTPMETTIPDAPPLTSDQAYLTSLYAELTYREQCPPCERTRIRMDLLYGDQFPTRNGMRRASI